MELMTQGSGLVARIAGTRLGDRFTLADIGCSGGIDAQWRQFGDKLRAFGFDPNGADLAALQQAETNPEIRYIPAFVSGDPDSDFARRAAGRPSVHWNPWTRLAVSRTMALQAEAIARMSHAELTTANVWNATASADASRPLHLPTFFSENRIGDIDFLKIDVDGKDFEILQSLGPHLDAYGLLGIGMEVNWIGSPCDTDHTFHNTDRYLREHGFQLFDLTTRKYSAAALPQAYAQAQPAQGFRGRIIQGDAIYFRDLGDTSLVAEFQVSNDKLLKLACLYDLFGLQDFAAEILVTYRDRLGDVTELLDILVKASDVRVADTYADYMARFDADDPAFYPSR